MSRYSHSRPASTGSYVGLWETKLQELMELLTRTSLESHKLDLMAEVSNLKIKLTTAEEDKNDLMGKLRQAQNQISELEARLYVKDSEISEIKQRVLKNGTILASDSADVGMDRPYERERTLDRLKKKQSEIEKLKKAVDSLMLANDEKDRRLEEYRKLLRRYKKVEEMVIQAQGRRALEDFIANADDDTSSTSSSTTPSVPDSSKDIHRVEDSGKEHLIMNPNATSTPVNSTNVSKVEASQTSTETKSPTATAAVPPSSLPRMLSNIRSNSCEDLTPTTEKTPPTCKRKAENFDTYGTLPKDRVRDEERERRRAKGFPTLGKTLLRVKSGKRSCSAPNLAHTEIVMEDDEGYIRDGTLRGGLHHSDSRRWKGIKRLFGRLKRSSSQDFEGDRQDEFKRGGIRATAGARLAWSKDLKSSLDSGVPFVRWDTEKVAAWLHEIGLNMYVIEAKRWIKNGSQLLRASPHDLEKELGLKSMLHRKKLQLALQAVTSETKDLMRDLNFQWVTRWLDDIGLPQYKDHFFDARIDGKMLHYMTVDDLLALKVTNELHHISIRRAIQILRLHNFNSQCLKRRPTPDEGTLQNVPGEVALWTSHRVMEWLRTIDLSEYAPNLRGSGVHGALMVLEPRFNAELFAQLLSIPQTKTLLRRHLNTHFISLIGNETQYRKREFETSPGYQMLVPNAKVKSKGKFILFGHKRSKSDTQADCFICPIEPSGQSTRDRLSNGILNYKHKNGALKEDSNDRDEMAAKEIGAVSKEISTLTDMLSQERFLADVQTSNV